MAVTKTYLVTNTLETRFLAEFVSSKNRKWIVLQHCRCLYHNINDEDYVVSDIMVHCDFIERNHDLDYFACFSNTQLTKYKKWEVLSPRQSFKVWFTDMEGKPYEVKSKAEEEVQARKKQMLALYEEEMKNKVWPPYDTTTGTDVTQTATTEEEDEPARPYISAFLLELLLIY
jgi:hypothetical protein